MLSQLGPWGLDDVCPFFLCTTISLWLISMFYINGCLFELINIHKKIGLISIVLLLLKQPLDFSIFLSSKWRIPSVGFRIRSLNYCLYIWVMEYAAKLVCRLTGPEQGSHYWLVWLDLVKLYPNDYFCDTLERHTRFSNCSNRLTGIAKSWLVQLGHGWHDWVMNELCCSVEMVEVPKPHWRFTSLSLVQK